MSDLSFTINGKQVGPIAVSEATSMIDLLHEHLNLTGTKFGCGIGVCRACSVIVDNPDGTSEIMRTCINNVMAFNNKTIRTIEGHATYDGDEVALSPVQQAFIEGYSFQCGWCTSGMVNAATVLLEDLAKQPVNKADIETVIEDALEHHICRCTGYKKYYEALKALIVSKEELWI